MRLRHRARRPREQTEPGGMRPQAKSHQKLEETGRVLPESLQRQRGPADTLISDLGPAS